MSQHVSALRSWSLAHLLALVAGIAVQESAARSVTDKTGWFTFYLPWNDTGSGGATDLSGSLFRPAGEKGFLEVGPEGRFRWGGTGERARFTGFTGVAEAVLPDTAVADVLAARLARFGVNLLRLHLQDVDGVYGLFRNSAHNTRELDPVRLARMDRFVAALAARGIHVNFCIHAGRVYKQPGDSLRVPVLNNQSKFVTIFEPRLMDLQEEFARQLANHVNPWRGLRYADDPAVVTWELTNENQLYLGWLSWGAAGYDSASASNPQGMHPGSYRYLDSLWNAWLQTRYSTDSVLAAAWAPAGTDFPNLVTNQSFETGTTGWSLWNEPGTGARTTMLNDRSVASSGSRSLRVRVLAPGSEAWHAQVSWGGVSARAGETLALQLQVRSSRPGRFGVQFLRESLWTWYGDGTCATDTSWSTCRLAVTLPEDLDAELRFNLVFGAVQDSTDFWIDDVKLRTHSGDGLRDDESMLAGTVGRSLRSTVGLLSAPRAADESRFLMHLESLYVDRLTAVLRDEGVRVPITFTQNWYGPASIASQARADYTGAHFYWQHPRFPRAWSQTDWTMGLIPMVRDEDGGTVAGFWRSSVAGKPFVVSEYNHPWPNPYGAEAPAFLYGWLGWLDADAALMHAYVDYTLRYEDVFLTPFFDVGLNPVLMTQMSLAHVFRHGRIAPAASVRIIDANADDLHSAARSSLDGIWPPMPVTAGLEQAFRWGSFDAPSTTPTSDLPSPGPVTVNSTGELLWDRERGVLRVDNPWWQGGVGFLREGASTSGLVLRDVRTTGGKDFAAIHAVSTDTAPVARAPSFLLLTSARIENRGLVWNDRGDGIESFMWGPGDSAVCEPVWGRVGMVLDGMGPASVWKLDPMGRRTDPLPVGRIGDTLWTDLPGTSLWYEVVRGDSSSPVAIEAHTLAESDPNGLRWVRAADGRLIVRWIPSDEAVRVVVRGVDGRVRWSVTSAGRIGQIGIPEEQTSGLMLVEVIAETGPVRSLRIAVP